MTTVNLKLQNALSALKPYSKQRPKLAMILGSGLGGLADTFDHRQAVPFSKIPGFTASKVAGHKGNLVFGKMHRIPVVAMQGRVHYYEGHPMEDVIFGVRVMRKLGADALIVTNAAGGINKQFKVGDLMLITDHINNLGTHPLRGENPDLLGPRFYDMTVAYDAEFRVAALACAKRQKLTLRQGVYVANTGPSYETPAEIRMMRGWGADAAGMSTVPEVLAARHMGMRVLGISCITNMAAGVLKSTLSHAEVIETTERVSENFKRLVSEIVQELAKTLK